MSLRLVALALVVTPVAVLAQNSSAPVPLTIDTPIEAIAADPKGKLVLEANFPGMTANPMYEQFKTMTLKQVQPMSGGRISEAAVAKTQADLTAIK